MHQPPAEAAVDQELSGIRQAVDERLDRYLREKADGPEGELSPVEVSTALRDLLFAGGKRIRPVLCVMGRQAAGGSGADEAVIDVAASLEMFHAFALIHDDIMDGSDTRRGGPALHKVLAARLGQGRDPAAAEHVGRSAAILAGDLALVYSDELLHTARRPPEHMARILSLVDEMRREVVYGQYLDITTAGKPTADVRRAMRIARYKTATYTFERPLHIGAMLSGATPPVLEALSAYGLPLGDAFQLRDDLLSVFGTPLWTGKPVDDDLRDGKHTVLVALALQRADATQRATLDALLGSPALTCDEAARVRDLIRATGAHEEVERMIRSRYEQARRALERAPFPAAVTAVLSRLARAAVTRTT
ncbi:polyprenyl synthetase family protein [Streptomyces sp. NPDC096339]|uniref:polyprenyl synthetase family protein n=1 Tax=Streptomyces sp. NPDC096339 TaxID=3366086 RepID=UPI00380FAF81